MSSKIKVDNIADQGDNNLINKCGSTITLGANGDTIELASGASQSGFGRTGTVDWQTSSIKTSTFTAVNGQGFFANTAGGAFDMNLPAGSAGAIVSVQDYNNTFDSNPLTIQPNGSEKVNGGTAGGIVTLSTEGEGLTLVYIDSTVGWRSIQDSDFSSQSSTDLIATGGTITCCGNYKIHTFTGPGTFTVTQASNIAANNIVSYLVVGGGAGGGAGDVSGGGGAGGFREYKGPVDCYSASPLNGNPGGTAITVTAQAYPITVGGGGAHGTSPGSNGTNGVNSIFSTVTSAGGGGGANGNSGPSKVAGSGGSGGGMNWDNGSVGVGNTPPVSPPQGNNGGGNSGPSTGPAYGAGGGGGASATGGAGSPSVAGAGGNGVTTSITASPVAYAGGGGGARNDCGTVASGGTGGGGQGGNSGTHAGCGADNKGGGGGGQDNTPAGADGGNGGSGVVIIRYKFQ